MDRDQSQPALESLEQRIARYEPVWVGSQTVGPYRAAITTLDFGARARQRLIVDDLTLGELAFLLRAPRRSGDSAPALSVWRLRHGTTFLDIGLLEQFRALGCHTRSTLVIEHVEPEMHEPRADRYVVEPRLLPEHEHYLNSDRDLDAQDWGIVPSDPSWAQLDEFTRCYYLEEDGFSIYRDIRFSLWERLLWRIERQWAAVWSFDAPNPPPAVIAVHPDGAVTLGAKVPPALRPGLAALAVCPVLSAHEIRAAITAYGHTAPAPAELSHMLATLAAQGLVHAAPEAVTAEYRARRAIGKGPLRVYTSAVFAARELSSAERPDHGWSQSDAPLALLPDGNWAPDAAAELEAHFTLRLNLERKNLRTV